MIVKKRPEIQLSESPADHQQAGFSLVEMSVVLLIVGLLLTVGATVMKTFLQSSKISKEKATIIATKNALTTYALTRGRLPCPDTNSDGRENCPVSSCAASPCTLPYIDLNLSTSSKDTWSLPYHYDVTDILTTSNSRTMCRIAYQVSNLYEWLGSPVNANCGASDLVCVTSVADADNGNIGTSATGYYIAAFIATRGEDRLLGGKNSADGRREYEMSSNAYDTTVGRDDLIGELSFAAIIDKVCTPGNTTMDVTITNGEVWLDNSGGCVATTGLTGTITVGLGQRLYYKTGCTEDDSFEELARCDLSTAAYNGSNSCVVGTPLNGVVSIDAAAATVAITQ